jgi:hypothetical protein
MGVEEYADRLSFIGGAIGERFLWIWLKSFSCVKSIIQPLPLIYGNDYT